MEVIKEWLGALLKSKRVKDETELTPVMLKEAIKESEETIRNEQIWSNGAGDLFTSLQHEKNITIYRQYIRYLRALMKKNGKLSEHRLCVSIYTEPDELPFSVSFLLPQDATTSELRRQLAKARDAMRLDDFPDIEGHFEKVLDTTAAAFDFGYWYYDNLTSLKGKEDLWNIK